MSGWCCPFNTNKDFHPRKLSGMPGQAEELVELCAWGRQLWAQAGGVIWVGVRRVCYRHSLPLQSPLQICLQPFSGLGAANKEGGE